jgi:hypothetical protein
MWRHGKNKPSARGGKGGRCPGYSRRSTDGLFIQRIPVSVPADLPRPVLPVPQPAPQPAGTGRQLPVLCLVAGGFPPAVRRRDAVELPVRPAHPRQRRHRGGAQMGGGRGGRQPGHTGLLQVRQLRCGQHQCCARGDGLRALPVHRGDPADRYFLLHLPVDQLPDRRAPQGHRANPQPGRLRRLHRPLPATDRRPRAALQGHGRPVHQSYPQPGQVLRRRHTLHAGLRQEGVHRRQPGATGRPLLRPGEPQHRRRLAGHGRLHRAAVLRLLRLQRYGHRPRPDDGFPLRRELQPALYQPVDHRVLAALAHQPVELAATVPSTPTATCS